ncbi:hypothetical protein [Thermococcus prieurii]
METKETAHVGIEEKKNIKKKLKEPTGVDNKEKPIGRVSATETDPNTSDDFKFWLDPDVEISPTDIVEVRTETGKVFGIIDNISQYSDSKHHIENFVSSNFGDTGQLGNEMRLQTNVAHALVLKSTSNRYMPVPLHAPVHFISPDSIDVALGIDEIKSEKPEKIIPAGIIELSTGQKFPAHIDVEYLLGPEGAHLNITGISGLATKTSYLMFLLKVLQEKLEDENVAFIVFNVKEKDLLHIDEPPTNLSDQDREMYSILEISSTPFRNVTYFVPYGYFSASRSQRSSLGYNILSDSSNRRPNTFEQSVSFHQKPNVKYYSYTLEALWQRFEYVFSLLDLNESDALFNLIRDVKEDIEPPSYSNPRRPSLNIKDKQNNRTVTNTFPVNTFNDLLSAIYNACNSSHGQPYRGYDRRTLCRFMRYLRQYLVVRNTGIFTDNPTVKEFNLRDYVYAIRPKDVYVIDIAKLADHEKAVVVGDVISSIYQLFSGEITYRDISPRVKEEKMSDFGIESEEEPVDEPIRPSKVVIVIDELNKYAPKSGRGSPVLGHLLEISERGRSLGIILFGAEQFASQIHPRILGNAANRIIGRTDTTELKDEAYRFLPQGIKNLIPRLEKGELILHHPLYRQPVKIKFPRPPYKQR